MDLSYPEHIPSVLESLPTTLDQCILLLSDLAVIYAKTYITNECAAHKILLHTSHIKYRMTLLMQDFSDKAVAFVSYYERSLPLMVWRHPSRETYVDEVFGKHLKVQEFNEVIKKPLPDVYELQICRVLIDEESEFEYYLPRLFKEEDESEHIAPEAVRCRANVDVRIIHGKVKRLKGLTTLESEDLQPSELQDSSPSESHNRRRRQRRRRVLKIPEFGTANGYRPTTYGKYQSYPYTSLVGHRFGRPRVVCIPRVSDVTGKFLSGVLGVPIYSGSNFTMWDRTYEDRRCSRKCKPPDVRTLEMLALQAELSSWFFQRV